MEDQDFRLPVNREQFEKLNADLFERVTAPVERALDAAGITMDLVDQVHILPYKLILPVVFPVTKLFLYSISGDFSGCRNPSP